MQHSLPALGCLLLASTCLAQTPNWVQVKTQNTPPGRWSHGFAYDFIRGRSVVFGGTSATGYMNDTWEYDGKNWTNMNPKTVPPLRRLTSMAYHLTRVKMLMFGGLTAAGVIGDTWEWNGTDWTQLTPKTSPGARRSAALAYDSSRQRTVLFGGHNGSAYVNDTWEWDGTNWTQIITKNAPSGRYTNMVYDSTRQRVVIHSGYPGYFGDTWEYDGKDWTQVKTPTTPAGRCCAGLAFDSARGRTVMFGGFSGYKQETWEYDGNDWTQIKPTASPLGRYGGDFMVYDQRRKLTVIFGGLLQAAPRQAADTWEYTGPPPALVGTPPTISIATGGTHSFALDAGTANSKRYYWILGSVTGTSPGVTLASAVGSVTIPLVPDPYTDLTIGLANAGLFVNTKAQLDSLGKNTTAKLVVPKVTNQGAIGLVLYHAFLVYDLQFNFYMASNPATLQLVK